MRKNTSIFIETKKIEINTINNNNINNSNIMASEINYSSLSINKLKTLCKEKNIKKYSNKNKQELIDLITNIEQIVEIKSKSNKKIKKPIVEVEPIVELEPIVEVEPILKPLSPLIKWSGGKSDEIKQFKHHFPSKYDIYLEPFIGGGSVFFYLNPPKAVIADVHTELIDLYTSIKESKSDEIYTFMEENNNTEETYYKIRDHMKINTQLDSAKRFYYQRKTCFRGMLRYNKNGKFNIPFGKYKTINYNDLKNKRYEELLKKTEIIKNSFEYVFENYNNENNFMFLDPPYDSEFTDYGYCKFEQDMQIKLAKYFKETKIKCLMIIGKTNFIEELYKDYIVEEYEKKYRFKLYAGRVGDEINTKHLIIKNY